MYLNVHLEMYLLCPPWRWFYLIAWGWSTVIVRTGCCCFVFVNINPEAANSNKLLYLLSHTRAWTYLTLFTLQWTSHPPRSSPPPAHGWKRSYSSNNLTDTPKNVIVVGCHVKSESSAKIWQLHSMTTTLNNYHRSPLHPATFSYSYWFSSSSSPSNVYDGKSRRGRRCFITISWGNKACSSTSIVDAAINILRCCCL